MFLTQVFSMCTVHTFSVSRGFGGWLVKNNAELKFSGSLHWRFPRCWWWGFWSARMLCCLYVNITYFDSSEGTQCLHLQRLIGARSSRIYQPLNMKALYSVKMPGYFKLFITQYNIPEDHNLNFHPYRTMCPV